MCLWFLARDKSGAPTRGAKSLRARAGETLFVDARRLGAMVSRTHRELTDEELARIVGAYHAWRGESGADEYADEPGFAKRVALEEIRTHAHVLTPGRYVGALASDVGDEGFEARVERLETLLREQIAEARHLDATILENLNRPFVSG